MNAPIGQEDLHAWLDGELDDDRARAVAAWVEEHPDQAVLADAYARQKRLLHAAFDPVLAEPVPERFARRTRYASWAARAAAAAVLLFVGGVAGWTLRGDGSTGLAVLPQRAAIAHVVYSAEVRHPVEVTAREEQHLVRWLSKRLGADVRAPKLAKEGFELLGGRLLPETGRPGAQFMYQDAAGRRLTLYVSTDVTNRETAFRYATEGDVHVFYWVDRNLGYALSGDIDKPTLLRVARSVYEQLNP